jgi:hypothetical protein
MASFYPSHGYNFAAMNQLIFTLVFSLVAGLWYAPAQANESGCRRFYDQVDRAIARAGVRDAQEAPVKAYPYLRSDRFLARLAPDMDNDARFDFLLQQLVAREQRARQLELRNLSPVARAGLEQVQRDLFPGQPDISTTLDDCAQTLLAADRMRPDAIKRAIRAPDSYSLFKRLLGFYPLTAIPFSRGIRKFQAEMTKTYGKNLSEVIGNADVVVHAPQPSPPLDVVAILQQASENPLRIPLPSGEQRAQLFAHFAPQFAIDTRADYDRPGALRWGDVGRPSIDATSATIYTLASHTTFAGQSLLQLNYVIWFSERPKKSKFDMLGGALDGLMWRVTLAPDGEPLLYDAIHPCGCYHVFFPTGKLRAKPRDPSLQEHAYVPQAAPRLAPGERPTLWLESATHYLVRVTGSALDITSSARHYELADYDELRSLPKNDGTRRSLFRPDGLIAGTERGERVLFWPMGIASAGAMRQWGHHATAFVGLRHFDDPDLIEKAFEAAN